MLETDNASMHLKLSKTQKDVNQRLTEIEMQIGPDDNPSDSPEEVFLPPTRNPGGVGKGQDSDLSNHRSLGDSQVHSGSIEDEEENNIESFI